MTATTKNTRLAKSKKDVAAPSKAGSKIDNANLHLVKISLDYSSAERKAYRKAAEQYSDTIETYASALRATSLDAKEIAAATKAQEEYGNAITHAYKDSKAATALAESYSQMLKTAQEHSNNSENKQAAEDAYYSFINTLYRTEPGDKAIDSQQKAYADYQHFLTSSADKSVKNGEELQRAIEHYNETLESFNRAVADATQAAYEKYVATMLKQAEGFSDMKELAKAQSDYLQSTFKLTSNLHDTIGSAYASALDNVLTVQREMINDTLTR